MRRPKHAAPRPARAAETRPVVTIEDIREAFANGPLAAAIALDGVVTGANEAFARTLGVPVEELPGRRLEELLPPESGPLPTPRPGAVRGYRTTLGGVGARVDLAAALRPRPDGRVLVSVVVTATSADRDTAADLALLALSRELAEARAEDQVTAALARALDVLFPGRSFCIRLVDPKTLALTTLYARGRLRPRARARLVLRRAAVARTGLSRDALEAGGVAIADEDEAIFDGSDVVSAVPLALGGQLFGVVNLEYVRGAPGDPEADAPLLYRLANHGALGIRNVRSVEELLYLKTFQEDLIQHANALIAVVNRYREVIVWNDALAKLTGFTRDDAIGADGLERFPPDERAHVEGVLLRGFAGEAVNGFETRLLRKDGGEVRIALNTAPVLGASGEVEGVIAIGQDLTLLRSLQAAAEHAERLAGLGRLVAGVVHELNNPLTAVAMYSDVLVEKFALPGHDPADLEKLRAIREAGLRIQRLARDLVTYARPTGARTEPVDLADVLEEATRLAKPALKETAAVLEKAFDEVPPVEANRASLVQVFVNLVTNAAQAVPSGGRIALALGKVGERAQVTVRDHGSGMAPDVAERAFEPFFTTRPGVGIGLGLPIVQGIVERHGGSITLETAPGRGTTVTVSLPVRRGAPLSDLS